MKAFTYYQCFFSPVSLTASQHSGLPLSRRRWRAKAVCDRDAEGKNELSLMSGETVNVLECEPREEDWVLAERPNGQHGRAPRQFLRYFQ